MALFPFRLEVFENPEVVKVQQNIEPIARQFNALPFADGVHLKEKTISGTTDLLHGLERAPIGWMITRKRGNAVVYDEQDNNKAPTKSLSLNSSADVEIDVWVF